MKLLPSGSSVLKLAVVAILMASQKPTRTAFFMEFLKQTGLMLSILLFTAALAILCQWISQRNPIQDMWFGKLLAAPNKERHFQFILFSLYGALFVHRREEPLVILGIATLSYLMLVTMSWMRSFRAS